MLSNGDILKRKGSGGTEFVVAILFAALAGLGVGGGGLLVIYLTAFTEMEQRAAQGVNLCFFIIASLAALFYYIGRRRINYALVLLCCTVGCASSVLGSFAAAYIPSEVLRRGFGAFIAVAGAVSLIKTCISRRKK